MVLALAAISCNSPIRFASSPAVNWKTPVMLPPGWLRLATRPSLTGTSPSVNTIGIDAVATSRPALRRRRPQRARPPDGESDRTRAPEIDRIDQAKRDPLSHSGLRYSRLLSGPRGTPRSAGAAVRATRRRGTQSRYRRLLRACGERPRGGSAKQRDEVAASHLIELHLVLPARAGLQDIELAGIKSEPRGSAARRDQVPSLC